MTTIKRVLVYTDFSEAAKAAVGAAKEVAARFESTLYVLHVIGEPLSAGWTSEVSAARMPELQNAADTELQDRLSEVLSEEDRERLDATFAIENGIAGDEIVRYAHEHHIDLVVLSRLADDDDAAALVGRVVDRAPCSVFVVRVPAGR